MTDGDGSQPDSIRSTLDSMGWRRGTIIDPEENACILEAVSSRHKGLIQQNNALLLITLYDCALIHDSFEAEPCVEYVLISRIEDVENQYAKGKNSRVFHGKATQGTEDISFKIVAGNNGSFDRRLLLGLSPSEKYKTSTKEQVLVNKWLTNRICQPTYPDSFNNRIINKKKEKFFKKYSSRISAFYIQISPPDRDLPEGTLYLVSIIASVEVDTDLRTLKQDKIDEEMRSDLLKFLNESKGIKVESFEVMAESQIRLSQLRDHSIWADEYFSYKTDPEGPLPVEHA